MTEYCRWHSTRRHTQYPPAPTVVAAPPADAPHPHARCPGPRPSGFPLCPPCFPITHRSCYQPPPLALSARPPRAPHLLRLLPPTAAHPPALALPAGCRVPRFQVRPHCSPDLAPGPHPGVASPHTSLHLRPILTRHGHRNVQPPCLCVILSIFDDLLYGLSPSIFSRSYCRA